MIVKNRLMLGAYVVVLGSTPCSAGAMDFSNNISEKSTSPVFCLTREQYICIKMSEQRKISEESFHVSEVDILRPLLCPEEEKTCIAPNNACTNTPEIYFGDCEGHLSTLESAPSTHKGTRERTLLGHMLIWGIGISPNPTKAYNYLYPLAYSTFYPPALFHLFILLASHAQKLPSSVPDYIHVLSFAKQLGFVPAKIYWDKNLLIDQPLPTLSSEVPAYLSKQKEAFLRINKIAETGNAQALYIRALLSLTQQDFTPFDPQAALKDLETAAAQHLTGASFLLGTLLYQGKQSYRDTPKALRDFQELSTQIDDPEKKIHLDIPRALTIFQKLADEGHPGALHMLITHYANNGEWNLAEKWVIKAMRHHNPLSTVIWFDHLTRLGGSPERIKQAISWLQENARPDAPEVQTRLGQIYFEGIYQPKNIEWAETYLTAATKDPHNLEASYRLAVLYIEYNGQKLVPNSSIARKTWGMNMLTSLSEKGFWGAKIHLIHFLLRGGPCEKDPAKAENLLKELPETYTPANYYRGLLSLEQGRMKKAKKYFLSAYDDGSSHAAFELGKLYHQGNVKNKQGQILISKAQTYLTFAVKRGHLEALQYLIKHFGYTNIPR